MNNSIKATCTECGWTGTLHDAGSHECIDKLIEKDFTEALARPLDREALMGASKAYRASIAKAVADYEARSAKYGVPVGTGRCIAEDHTGHGHKE